MSENPGWQASMPEIYDRQLGSALFAPFALQLAQQAAALVPPRVLELAAGTGIVTAELLRALPEARITATDLSPAMVAWGAQRAPEATWLQADAQHLDFPDGAFDLVACQFGVMFFPDKPGAFAEAGRVMAPSGTLMFSVWDSVENSAFPAALTATLAEVLPDDPPDFVARVPHGYADPAQITRDMEAGGLQPITVERLVLHGNAPSARDVAEGYCLGTPLRFALQARGNVEDLTRAVADAMEARLGVGPVTGNLTAYFVTARRPPLRGGAA